jgi:hypothetical protein
VAPLGESLLNAWFNAQFNMDTPDDGFEHIDNNLSYGEQYDTLIDLENLFPVDMKPLENKTLDIIFQFFSIQKETVTLPISDPRAFAIKMATEVARVYSQHNDRIILLRVKPYFDPNLPRAEFLRSKELIFFIDDSGDLRGGYYLEPVPDLDLTSVDDFISNFPN